MQIKTLAEMVAMQEERVGDHLAAAEAEGHVTTIDGRNITCTCGYASTSAPGAQTLTRKIHAAESLGLITIGQA